MVYQAGNFSRLERKNRESQLRQMWLWIGLTAGLILLLIFVGVPSFIKLAGWWGDMNSSSAGPTDGDTLAPAPPRLSLATDATNSSILNLAGYSEPGTSVEIFLNQQSVKTVTTEATGQFLANDLTLQEGNNEIYAKAKDEAGNESAASKTETLLYDSTPVKLEIESPQDGATFYGSGQKKLEVKGTAEPEAEVTVNNRGVIVDQNGKFVTTLQLADGEQLIKIAAKDEAGNETEKEIKVTYSP